MMIKNKHIFTIAAAAVLGLAAGSLQAAHHQPDEYITDVITGAAPQPAKGLNNKLSADQRRDACAFFIAYAALQRTQGGTPNQSIQKVNKAKPGGCIDRLEGAGWGKL